MNNSAQFNHFLSLGLVGDDFSLSLNFGTRNQTI